MEKALKTTDLRLARVKWYDTEHNGAELSSPEAYAFLQKINEDTYINPFDPVETLPVLDRSIYPNVMANGEEFGNRLIHVSGELTTGPCYVIERRPVEGLFGEAESVTLNQLKTYILRSKKFFVDRPSIILEFKGRERLGNFRQYLKDMTKMNELKQFFASHEKGREYVK